ncbi:viral membrane formation protein [Skunkpox virus]|uniref:Protein OPG137 n=1 Tax=Skunkpox virus TaxID=160796 RepID=A0A1C9KBU2_9POXV|nr:viral membrane formation protein [Skunkpox virus]AOP31608.1 viral membrane formation protein [Skunkpox virus]
MTTVPVTDIQNDLITEFSEDNYPSNKNYEITLRQMSILTHVNNVVDREQNNTAPSPEEISSQLNEDLFPDDDSPATIIERVQQPQTTIIDEIQPPTFRRELLISEQRQQREKRFNITVSKNAEAIMESRSMITSMPTQTPSLGVVYDKDKRIQMLEDEVVNLRNQRSNTKSSDNLDNFTRILFGKTPYKSTEVNKRIAIVNYANLNGSPLSVEDLDVCSEDEIDRIYKTIKQYHESRKRKIIVTNVIIIVINIIEQALLKLGFEEIKGLSADVTSEIIDVEIGDDCDAVASKLGIGNSPVLNIVLFILKIFVKRIKII